MEIRKATQADSLHLALLASRLFSAGADELLPEFTALTASGEAACFLATDAGQPVGFAQCQLRHDYVEGTQSSPVGYLEGIYVSDALRGKGGARALVRACEVWAASWGCTEFASDCELDNTASFAFHLKMGFEEASRNIHFAKKI